MEGNARSDVPNRDKGRLGGADVRGNAKYRITRKFIQDTISGLSDRGYVDRGTV